MDEEEIVVRLTLKDRAKFARETALAAGDVEAYTKRVKSAFKDAKSSLQESDNAYKDFSSSARQSLAALRSELGSFGGAWNTLTSVATSPAVKYGLGGLTLGFTA